MIGSEVELRLRPLRETDEPAIRAAHQTMAAESFTFALDLESDTDWQDYLRRLDDCRKGVAVPLGFVPATFLVAEVGGEIVGRSSVRHRLNEHLAREGGHIGYCVLPSYRRRGYATEILRQSLVIARATGVDRVLVTCDDDNIGSSKAIEACGGKLESVVPASADGTPKRRYWIG